MPAKKAQQNVAANVPPSKPHPKPSSSPPGAAMTSRNPITILTAVYRRYLLDTPQRTKIIDAFLGFLIVTGLVQFAYCVVAGNYVCFSNKDGSEKSC
jgi:oligosaccharyltransferase complex subunit epsilon